MIVSNCLSQTIAELYADVIAKGLDYVYETVKTMDDVYCLALAAYAAQLAKYVHRDELLQKLDSMAKTNGNFANVFGCEQRFFTSPLSQTFRRPKILGKSSANCAKRSMEFTTFGER